MAYHKCLSVIIATIGLTCAVNVFAASTNIGSLNPYTGGESIYGVYEFLSDGLTGDLQDWSGQVTSQVNTNTSGISANLSAINTLNNTTIPGISTTIAALPTTIDVTTDINNAIANLPTVISSSAANNINTAIGSAISTAGNPANNAVNTATANAMTEAEAPSGSITTAITSATTPLNNTINGTTNGGVTTYGLAQHMGSGFWFANSNLSLRTALANAGAEAAKNGNSQTVKLSGGIYTLSNVLTIPINVTLEGAGEAATRIITNYDNPAHYPIQMSQDSTLANLTINDATTTSNSLIALNYAITDNALPDNFTLSHIDIESPNHPAITAMGPNNNIFTLEIESSFIHANAFYGDTFSFGDTVILKNNQFAASGSTAGCAIVIHDNLLRVITTANQGQESDNTGWVYCPDSDS